MKKIAILSSGNGKITRRLASLFNEGNRIRVELVLSDQVPDRIIDDMMSRGINAVSLPRVIWENNPEEVIRLIDDSEVELLVLDEFKNGLPSEIQDRYKGRIVVPETEEAAPRDVVTAFANMDAEPAQSCFAQVCEKGEPVQPQCESDAPEAKEPSAGTPGAPMSADEEWAETLKIKFDAQTAAQTPPPLPGAEEQTQAPGREWLNDRNAQNTRNNPSIPDPQSIQGQPYNQANPQYPGGRMPTGSGYGHGNPGNQEPMPSTYLIWSILCTVFCCFIPGIVAIVFSSQVSSKYYVGDIDGAKKASQNAQIWIIVSFVLGVISTTLYLPIMMLT